MNFQPPVPEKDALSTRLGMLKGDESIRGTPAEGMMRLFKEVCGAAAANEAAERAGFASASFNMLQKYPLREFLLLEQSAAEQMAAVTGTFDAAIFNIGAAAVHLFFDSVAGKTMKLLAGREPHRLLAAVPNGYSVLVNFGDREYTKTGERSGTFIFKHELLGSTHTAGIFDAALRAVYGVEPRIVLEYSSVVDFKFKISW